MIENMRNLLLGLLLAGGILLAHSCGPLLPDDGDKPEPENVRLDREFMDYLGLPDNSYWIYRNVLTGELDSSYIGGTDTTMKDVDFGRQRVEYLHEYRFGSLQLRGSKYSCKWYTNKGTKTAEPTITTSNYLRMASEALGTTKIMSWKDNDKEWEWHKDSQNHTITNYYDSIQLGGVTYQDVVHIETGDSWETKTAINQTYYAKGVGPVYRIFSDGSEWELIRYQRGAYILELDS